MAKTAVNQEIKKETQIEKAPSGIRTVGKKSTLEELLDVADLAKSKGLRQLYEEEVKAIVENGEIRTIFLNEMGSQLQRVRELLNQALALPFDCTVDVPVIPDAADDLDIGAAIIKIHNERMKVFSVLEPLVNKYSEVKRTLNFLETAYATISFADTQWRASSEFNIILRDTIDKFIVLESRISALRAKLEFVDTSFSIISRLITIRQLTIAGASLPSEVGNLPLQSGKIGNSGVPTEN
jgi:ribosomal protein S13